MYEARLSEKLPSSRPCLKAVMTQPWKDLGRVLTRPTAFFATLNSEKGLVASLGFLLLVSLLSSTFDLVLVSGIRGTLFAIFFANGFLTPLITAVFLYLPVNMLSRKSFSMRSLIVITSYAQAPLLLSWIPGTAWLLGLWKLWLVGIGLHTSGKLRFRYNLCSLFIAEGLMLLFVSVCRFFV